MIIFINYTRRDSVTVTKIVALDKIPAVIMIYKIYTDHNVATQHIIMQSCHKPLPRLRFTDSPDRLILYTSRPD